MDPRAGRAAPARTPALRPETTIGHKTARLTPSRRYRAHILPGGLILPRRGC